MPATASKGSSLSCPLNELFGSRGRVGILRVLAAEAGSHLHPGEIARRAGLSESGTWDGLNRLSRTGFVERVRTDGSSRFRLAGDGFLSREVIRLFAVEGRGIEELARSLREAALTLSHPPALVWIQDYLSGWASRQEVGVVCQEGRRLDLDELGERVAAVGGKLGVELEVCEFSRDEAAEVDWDEAIVILGEAPGSGRWTRSASDSGGGPRGTRPLEPDSPEFSRALVAFLKENLSVLQRAREDIRKSLEDRPNGRSHDLWEWQKILDTFSLPRLLGFLGSDSPRAVRLRKCSPFPGVLSEEEKARMATLLPRED